MDFVKLHDRVQYMVSCNVHDHVPLHSSCTFKIPVQAVNIGDPGSTKTITCDARLQRYGTGGERIMGRAVKIDH